MTNKHLARLLKETASLVELTGGNPFRARAFGRAARTLERLEADAATLAAEGTLTEVPGIGKGLAAQIGEVLAYGSFELRDELITALPPGLLDLLRVKGLGVKRVRLLWKELGITDLEALEQAAAVGRLASVEGFGAKTQANVLANVRLQKQYLQQRRYASVVPEVEALLGALRAMPRIHRAEAAGAFRRALETLSGVDLCVAAEDPVAVQDALAALFPDATATQDEDALLHLPAVISDGLPLCVRVAPPDGFGTAWWYATGADDHVAAFEARYGRPADHAEEDAVYTAAGLVPVPSELREGDAALDAAAEDALPVLLTVADLRGSLHNHSTYSDGAHTLAQMAAYARRMGLSYFGICDHSQSLRIANGMPAERVREQQEEIRRLNATFAEEDAPPFRIFSGIESDILADGSLDYPDDILASFDFVVASVHTRFNMSEQEATERVLTAVRHPYTTILGHPTGRLLLAREGYPLDHAAVIAACAEAGVALELNANPFRLDLDWRWIRPALDQGVMIAINPDAHAMEQLDYVRWGVAVARKGGLTARECLNAWSLDAFTRWLEARRPAQVA